ncbi:sensor histidine kinase [Azospirillum doebereinerae]
MNRIARAWRRVPTVSAKFLLIFVPALALAVSLLSAVFFHARHRDLRVALHDRVAAIADGNAAALATGPWPSDTDIIRGVVQAIAANRDLVCVELSDTRTGQRIAGPGPDCPPEPGGGPDPDSDTVRRPIGAGDLEGGTLTLRYGQESVREQLRLEVTNTAVLLLLTLAGAVAVALVALRLTVGRPLHRLVAAIQESERGQDHRAVDWSAADEMGQVILAHNATMARLEEEQAALRQRILDQRDLAQELADERNVLQVTLDNTDQGIIKVDRDLRVVLSNRRAAEFLDLPPEFLAASPSLPAIVDRQRGRGEFDDMGDDPDLHLGRSGTESVFDRPSTFKRRRPDGRIVELRTNPLPDGGFVRTLTDVTVEARSAEEIFHAMQALETAYAELKETQDHLVQAEKMASLALLVAGVAHEINTPVGIAFGCASHLSSRTKALGDAFESGTMRKSDLTAYVAAAGESSRLIQQNLTRAAELIQSFKRVAVDQTSEERRRFDLLAYLEEIVTSLGPTLRKTPHRVAIACSPGILLDSFPGALSQVVTNLVMNALIHAFPERKGQMGKGHMVIDVDDPGDGELVIRFSDDGVGIPEEHRPRVFEPFFTTRRGTGGSGLGLHIVFNLATRTLGGRISVDSTPGDGTTFTLRIPKTASDAASDGPKTEARGVETEPA